MTVTQIAWRDLSAAEVAAAKHGNAEYSRECVARAQLLPPLRAANRFLSGTGIEDTRATSAGGCA